MRGLEPPTSASQTLNFEAKTRLGINRNNLAKLSSWYLTDRINTKGLTHFSQITIEGHFRRLLHDFDTVPNSIQLSEWLGKYSPGARKRFFETFRAFGRWLEKKKVMRNPWSDIDIPRVPVPLLKAPSPKNVMELFTYLNNNYPPELALRNKAIIAVFVESGLRLFELSSIKPEDINWSERTIRVWGKGRKEGKAPFGQTSETLLQEWISQYNLNGGNIWDINRDGIQVMLKRLHQATGIICNPHSFRRAFASILLKSGTDSLDIKRLGRWQNLQMVDRYMRSVQFEDSLKHYRSPLD
ncbi:tyrosine-type recombinase/integrase [Chloroflexota bacterium]